MIRICVVGAGPRGTVAVERISASAPLLAAGHRVQVHVVDPYPPGGGRVWRREQPHELLMNTVAGDITVFTDDSVTCDGPLVPGPTQYRWARMVADGEVPEADDRTRAEAATMRPWSYATRAFQGQYLGWAFRHIVRRSPETVTVTVHRTHALRLADLPDGRQRVDLADGDHLLVDAVVLAQGHYAVRPTAAQAALADFAGRHGLYYLPPASPAEADLSPVAAGQPVLLRGLGLNFYDYMALFSEGRGGRFRPGRHGRLDYLPSGREPVLYAGSDRGVPYRARAEIHREVVPRYRPDFLDAEEIRRLRRHAGTGRSDFRADLLPLVSKEIAWVYYRALLRDTDPAAHDRIVAEYPAHDWDSPAMAALIEDCVPDPALRWDWHRLGHPADRREFRDRADYRAWAIRALSEDLRQSRLGPAGSATKAAAAALRDLRDEVRQVISHRGISGASYRDHVDGWFSGLTNYAASGPPMFRVAQLLALIRADVVRLLGPRARITADERRGVFAAASDRVPGPPVTATAFLEAHLPLNDIRRATDPLLAALRDDGGCRPHIIPDRDGPGYQTGGVDVTEGTFQVVDAGGRPHPARFAYGPPVESVQWVTAIGARPHVNSRTLLQGDSIARSCLRYGARRAGRDRAPAGVHT